ncbi:MAG: penicillin-binding protein [Balneolaceae bacterium]|nr:MAG: penicillin-binding protein [Balneolaceae bacterium]
MNKKIKNTTVLRKRWLISAIILLFIVPFIYFMMIWLGYFGPMPDQKELSQVHNYQAAQVYSADGVLLGTYYVQNRTEITLDDINPVLIDALLSIEDIRFYDHNGVDKRALLRVFVRTILLGQDSGGGSTITQQLAKNLYPRERNGWLYLVSDKVREMIIARRMESVFSKDEILVMYLNTVSFGEDVFGIDMASRRFFNKRPADLEIHEAAALTGMLRATSWYNPHRNPESALQRRNVVIRQMERYGKISAEIADIAVNMPISTNYSLITTSDGPAPYFREHLRQELARILKDYPALDDKKYNLYTDGLVIQTTIDSRVQKAAENAVKTRMNNLQSIFDGQYSSRSIFSDVDDPAVLRAWRQTEYFKQLTQDGTTEQEIQRILYEPVKTQVFTWNGYEEMTLSPYDLQRHYLSFLNSGFLAMHPNTGDVLAWVGGINHHHFKYDHVKSRRQTGSAFKPFVYAAAIENGIKPCDYRRNVLTLYSEYEGWMPRNVREEYGGRYSLQAALSQSINTITVELLMETGLTNVINTATGLGIQSAIPEEPSIALGTAELSLLELTASYAAFLNSGRPVKPRTISAIYNSAGELIYDFNDELSNTESVISSETASAIVNILSKAINEGTGQSLRSRFGITHAVAGKTGTTQNFADGWFIGMTPDMVFGSWVGGAVPRVRFRNNLGYASHTALPIAGHFLSNLRNQPGLEPQRNDFYPQQIQTRYDLACEDVLDDRFRDRTRDFFTGRTVNEPREARTIDRNNEDRENRSVLRRIGSIFSRDRN